MHIHNSWKKCPTCSQLVQAITSDPNDRAKILSCEHQILVPCVSQGPKKKPTTYSGQENFRGVAIRDYMKVNETQGTHNGQCNNSELLAKLLSDLDLKRQQGRTVTKVRRKQCREGCLERSGDLWLRDTAIPRKTYSKRTKGINNLNSFSSFPLTSCGSIPQSNSARCQRARELVDVMVQFRLWRPESRKERGKDWIWKWQIEDNKHSFLVRL